MASLVSEGWARADTTASGIGPSVAVIGCGPAGMFFLRQLEKERERLLDLKQKIQAEGPAFTTNNTGRLLSAAAAATAASIDDRLLALPRPTVYEKESSCGGLWQSKLMVSSNDTAVASGDNQNPSSKDNRHTTDRVEKSESVYDGMWINAPKELFEFEDYTFDEHFLGRAMPPFLTRHQVLGYIEGATERVIAKHDANGSIFFDTEVDWIGFDKTTGLFSVDSVDTGTPRVGKYSSLQIQSHLPAMMPDFDSDTMTCANIVTTIPQYYILSVCFVCVLVDDSSMARNTVPNSHPSSCCCCL